MSQAISKIAAIRFRSGAIAIKWSLSHHDIYNDTGHRFVKGTCTLKTHEKCTSPEILEYTDVEITREVE